MPSLEFYLQRSSYRFLLAICRAHHLSPPRRANKATLVRLIHQTLTGEPYLNQLRSSLPAPATAILKELYSAGGILPAHYIFRRYGPVHPWRPWQPETPRRPWENPASEVERLWFLGLIFIDARADQVIFPVELASLIPPAVSQLPAPPAANSTDPLPFTLRFDLACLLGLLYQQPAAPLHGQWLPPRRLVEWGRWCAQSPQISAPRSELQTERRRFLHFLAEQGNLLQSHPFFSLTPLAWKWIALNPAAQAEALWQAWCNIGGEQWRAWRLPGSPWLAQPSHLLTPLHSHLAELKTALPQPAGQVAEAFLRRFPHLLDLVPVPADAPAERLIETVIALINGPLTWLGLINGTANTVELTAWGRHLLAGEPAPVVAPEPPLTLMPHPDLEDALLLIAPTGFPAPSHATTALILGEMASLPTNPASVWPPVAVTAGSFIRAIHQGLTAPYLRQQLAKIIERPLNHTEDKLLRGWAEKAGRMVIHPLMVLETTDPAIISRLAQSRRGRAMIVRTLSTRAVAVDGTRLKPLVGRLIEQEGAPPLVVSNQKDKEEPITLNAAAYAALAVKAYQRLGEFINLPAPVSTDLITPLIAGLDEATLAAVETAVEQTVAAVKDALIGRLVYPPWPEEGLPVTETMPVIEQAIARGKLLEITYYALNTDSITRRIVEPHRVDWWGATDKQTGIPILVGFCRRAQAERHFRLDRIQEIKNKAWE